MQLIYPVPPDYQSPYHRQDLFRIQHPLESKTTDGQFYARQIESAKKPTSTLQTLPANQRPCNRSISPAHMARQWDPKLTQLDHQQKLVTRYLQLVHSYRIQENQEVKPDNRLLATRIPMLHVKLFRS